MRHKSQHRNNRTTSEHAQVVEPATGSKGAGGRSSGGAIASDRFTADGALVTLDTHGASAGVMAIDANDGASEHAAKETELPPCCRQRAADAVALAASDAQAQPADDAAAKIDRALTLLKSSMDHANSVLQKTSAPTLLSSIDGAMAGVEAGRVQLQNATSAVKSGELRAGLRRRFMRRRLLPFRWGTQQGASLIAQVCATEFCCKYCCNG